MLLLLYTLYGVLYMFVNHLAMVFNFIIQSEVALFTSVCLHNGKVLLQYESPDFGLKL